MIRKDLFKNKETIPLNYLINNLYYQFICQKLWEIMNLFRSLIILLKLVIKNLKKPSLTDNKRPYNQLYLMINTINNGSGIYTQ